MFQIERPKSSCRWRGTFVHPEHTKNGLPLVEIGTWRLIRNGTMLEVRRRSNWGDNDENETMGKWIFKELQ